MPTPPAAGQMKYQNKAFRVQQDQLPMPVHGNPDHPAATAPPFIAGPEGTRRNRRP
jgi:hypothetical protein